MKRILIIWLSLIAFSTAAQEFKPHPRAKITQEQWQTYFDQVKTNHQASERQFPSEHLVTYDDRKSEMSWAFTTPGHPAHPAWVTRMPAQDGVGVYIRQIGYFAGNEPEFAKMFKAYQALNDKMREQFKKGELGK